jgi:hypothetical protein
MLKTNNRILLLTLVLASLAANLAGATEQNLAAVTRDDSSTKYQLILEINEGTQDITNFYKDIYKGGKKTSRDVLDVNQLKNHGLVLEQKDKRIILTLLSDNFDKQQGGLIEIDTLYNGVNNKRKTYELSLSKGKVGWSLMNKGKVVKELFIQTNKVAFVGTVGIKNVQLK